MRAPKRIRTTIVLGLFAALAVALAACGGGDDAGDAEAVASGGDAPQGVFVGAVQGSDAYIAVISDGRRVAGYLCDDGEASTWFGDTELAAAEAALETRDGEPLGSVALAGEEATGTVAIDGSEHAFSARLAADEAGAYRATLGSPGRRGYVEAGWVVLDDGTQRGALKSVSDPNADPVVGPAPDLPAGGGTVKLRGASAATQQLTPGFTDKVIAF